MSRINISLSEEVQRRAKDLIETGAYDGLSDLIKSLVRDEYLRVFNSPISYNVETAAKAVAAAALNDAHAATPPRPVPAGVPAAPARYRSTSAPRKKR